MSNNIDTLNYTITQHTKDLVSHNILIESNSSDILALQKKDTRRRTYLKKLLLYKAQTRFKEKVNDYIVGLYSIYNIANHILPSNMDTDPTPTWQIADTVLSEENEQDKNAFIDIFKYVFEVSPEIYFL